MEMGRRMTIRTTWKLVNDNNGINGESMRGIQGGTTQLCWFTMFTIPHELVRYNPHQAISYLEFCWVAWQFPRKHERKMACETTLRNRWGKSWIPWLCCMGFQGRSIELITGLFMIFTHKPTGDGWKPFGTPLKKAGTNIATKDGNVRLFIMIILTGWWFGTCFMTFHILGIIIPTDVHIFQRGWNHQPVTEAPQLLVD